MKENKNSYSENQNSYPSYSYPKMRRSYLALPDNQKKAFFICMKMLGILPPPDKYREYSYYTFGYSNNTEEESKKLGQHNFLSTPYKPKFMHDCLIAMHATSCEHSGSLAFGHYHRHLTLTTEIWVVLAHDILKTGPEALKKVGKDWKKRNFYEAHYQKNENQRKLWDKVFLDYQKLNPNSFQMALHYWNPCNYNQAKDLIPPHELNGYYKNQKTASGYTSHFEERVPESIDELFYSANNSYPWEINVVERWSPYDENGKVIKNFKECQQKVIKEKLLQKETIKQKDNTETVIHFTQEEAEKRRTNQYTQGQISILQNELNPRSGSGSDLGTFFEECYGNNPVLTGQDLDAMLNGPQDNGRGELYRTDAGYQNNNTQNAGIRNFEYFKDTKYTKITTLALSPQQCLINYGASKIEMQFLNVEQIDGISIDSNEDDYTRRWKSTAINAHLPPVLLANVLYGSTTNNFQDYIRKVQDSHNVMHNQMRLMMSDADFSITNLLFFTYHSWVDAMLQMGIQKYDDNSACFQQYLHCPNNQTVDSFTIYNGQRDGYCQKNGDYPIVQYANPLIRFLPKEDKIKYNENQLVKVATSYEYMMVQRNGKKRIRTTLDMHSFYQNKGYENIYQKYKLESYNFNYDYMITNGEQNNKIFEYQLGLNTRRIPDYLAVIEPFITSSTARRNDSIKAYLYHLKSNISSKQLYQVIQKSLAFFGKYRSDIKNKAYPISVKFQEMTKLKPEDFKNVPSALVDYINSKIAILNHYIKDRNIFIKTINYFGKQNRAVFCPKCKEFKTMFFDLGMKILNSFPELWQIINLKIVLCNQFVYDSRKKIEAQCITSFIKSLSSSMYQEFNLATGAEQVRFKFDNNLKSLPEEKYQVSIEIDSLSVENNKTCSLIKHINYSFEKQFHFQKIKDSTSTNSVDFVYKKVKIQIKKDGKSKEHSFNIPSFQNLVRYVIRIDKEGEILVEDEDFDFKVAYYKNFELRMSKGQ